MFNDSLIAFWLSKKDIFFRLLEATFFYLIALKTGDNTALHQHI